MILVVRVLFVCFANSIMPFLCFLQIIPQKPGRVADGCAHGFLFRFLLVYENVSINRLAALDKCRPDCQTTAADE